MFVSLIRDFPHHSEEKQSVSIFSVCLATASVIVIIVHTARSVEFPCIGWLNVFKHTLFTTASVTHRQSKLNNRHNLSQSIPH